ncbi:MAG TPA: T9SS type A sorting domain-containing protein, partial [Ignavibacteriales bacterium]|nr:T9SS type A sorting domain-containing protein [Ignavibacteriales bacterium]
EEKPAGSYSVTFDASNLPSGVYIYRLQTPGFTQNRKMTFLK